MAKKKRELGEISQEDLSALRDIAEVMTMEAFSVNQLVGMLEDAWVLGHNQGYEDANTERDSL